MYAHSGTTLPAQSAGGRTISEAPKEMRFGSDYLPEGKAYTRPALTLPTVALSLLRYVNRSYGRYGSETRRDIRVSEIRVTDKPNQYGHSVFATIIYGSDGYAGALLAGKVEGKRIIWTTYMD